MVNLAACAKKTKNQKKITPGVYASVVKSVEWAEGYVEGVAFTVFYELKKDECTVVQFKELFHNNTSNERTCDFVDYLQANGINDLEEFTGCTERLKLAKNVKNGITYIQITDREFISATSAGVANVDVQ